MNIINVALKQCTGLAKLGNTVAETLLHTQTFPSLGLQENFASMISMQENVFESSKQYFCFKDTNVASATYVS